MIIVCADTWSETNSLELLNNKYTPNMLCIYVLKTILYYSYYIIGKRINV